MFFSPIPHPKLPHKLSDLAGIRFDRTFEKFAFQKSLHVVFAGQGQLVLGDEKPVVNTGERVFNQRMILSRAKEVPTGGLSPLVIMFLRYQLT